MRTKHITDIMSYPYSGMRRGKNWWQFCLKKFGLLLCCFQPPGHLGLGSFKAGATRLPWSWVVVGDVALQLAFVGCLDKAEVAEKDIRTRPKSWKGWRSL